MKTRNMTHGDPLRAILLFALPLFVGNIFQQIYNVVDTMTAGYWLGDGAIAALGATTSLYGLLIDLAWGLNNGCGIVVARAFGSGDREELKRTIATMMVLDAVVTLLLTALSSVCVRPLMMMLNVPPTIFEDAYRYIAILLGCVTATVAYNMFAGIMQSLGNSRVPLYFLIFSSVVNILLDVLFIGVFGWGVSGAAAATVAAQSVSALLSGAYVFTRYRELMPGRTHFRLEMKRVTEMGTTGLSMAMMLCVISAGGVFYQSAINSLGTTLIVAHTAARRIIQMMILPMASICTANSTFVSQNYGAGRLDRIRETMHRVLALVVAWGLLSCALIWATGVPAVRLLTATSDAEVIRNAVFSLRIHFVFYPALGVLLVLRTAMQALRMRVIPVVSSGFELAMKIICGTTLIPAYGFLWVCIAEPIIWVVCAVFLSVVWLVRRPTASFAGTAAAEA